MDALIHFIVNDVWIMPIIFCSFFVIGIAGERIYALIFRYSVNANAFAAQIQKLVMTNNIDRAIKLCNTVPNAALPRVLKAALTRANRGEKEISDAVEVATIEALRDINRRTPILPNLSNLATLLGLLGTIVGLIDAFAAVADAPPEMKNQLLTRSLGICLRTTAAGLLVAIPALGIFIYLMSLTQKIVDDIDLFGLKVQQLLVARGKGDTSMHQQPGQPQ